MHPSSGSPADIDHLFRHEHGRMVATVTRIFGVHNLKLAEDVVQDAFCRALEVWKIIGLPENPSAWLMTAAKNRALDAIRRERTARKFAPELDRLLRSEWSIAQTVAEHFEANAIRDDLLRMMFSCCHPGLPEEAQVALMLNILCGFSASEIAAAFVSGRDAVEKRITRSKHLLARSGKLFEIASAAEFAARLPAVRRAVYLLFNEGYHGAAAVTAVRVELCREAIRLARTILQHKFGASPISYALCALLCLDAARMPGRLDRSGNLHSLFDQDRSQWDRELIAEGLGFLELSAAGSEISEYHVEAAIAAVHANAPCTEDTDWQQIVSLYDTLMQIRPSPIVALNRAIAVGRRDGAERGLQALHTIEGGERLSSYPFYAAALGEFELETGHADAAREHFRAARNCARNPEEKRFFERRIDACSERGDVRFRGRQTSYVRRSQWRRVP
jgi:RNA polymerase sigma factor (sigma-70 family)